MTLKYTPWLAFLLLFHAVLTEAQDPAKFRAEVDSLRIKYQQVNTRNAIVFTGSSSIRLWSDLTKRFPDSNIINTGFGGSQMSDLYYYTDDLILKFKPTKIFIYEADNDLGNGKTSNEILQDAAKVLKLIRCELSKKVKVFFITPKPSIKRWALKSAYEDYIGKLKIWAAGQKNVGIIDVWTPMLDANGELKKNLFLEDNLHLNETGYDLWTSVIGPYLKKK
jgi:lysophospholipase L1-like esterase